MDLAVNQCYCLCLHDVPGFQKLLWMCQSIPLPLLLSMTTGSEARNYGPPSTPRTADVRRKAHQATPVEPVDDTGLFVDGSAADQPTPDSVTKAVWETWKDPSWDNYVPTVHSAGYINLKPRSASTGSSRRATTDYDRYNAKQRSNQRRDCIEPGMTTESHRPYRRPVGLWTCSPAGPLGRSRPSGCASGPTCCCSPTPGGHHAS